MKKITKGSYGYIKHYRNTRLISSLILFAMILFIIVSLFLSFGDTKRVGVVFAILLSLPFAKQFIGFLMVINFNSMSKEDHSKLDSSLSSDLIIYDIVLSKYEGMRFYYALCIKNGWVYALVPDKNFNDLKKDYSLWIKDTINDGKYEYKVGIYKDSEEFCRKVKNAGNPNDKNKLIDNYIKERLIEMGV